MVLEMKGWNGKGDPEVKASLHSLEAFRPVIENKQDPLDLLPCTIVYCVGGYLSLPCYPLLTPHGTLIGFSGTVLTDRFQLESLTDCFTLDTNVHEMPRQPGWLVHLVHLGSSSARFATTTRS